MAFADPQSVTIGAETTPLPRSFTGTTQGKFTGPDSLIELRVNPAISKSGRSFRTASLGQRKTTADALVSTVNVRVNASVRLVIDRPASGFSDLEILNLVKGLTSWLSASTDANLKKLVAGEN